MLVPIFSLTQSEESLIVKVHLPLADFVNSELLVEDGIFYLTACPYYLKFKIPGEVIESEEHITCSLKDSNLYIKLTKCFSGEIFTNLDLISKLLINNSSYKSSNKVLIQPIENEKSELDDGTVYNWFCPIKLENDSDKIYVYGLYSNSYGFANSKSHLFESKPELLLALDLPDPDSQHFHKRHMLQKKSVQEKFNHEHYIADFCEPEATAAALSVIMPWMDDSIKPSQPEFSQEQLHRLTVLANRSIPILPPVSGDILTRSYIYLGLLDLLLAYLYDFRIREGDENPESAWTIAKVASSLSWFEVFTDLPTLMKTFYERALSFPLIRNWKLCKKVQHEVGAMLQHDNSKSWILYVLLELRRMIIEYSGYYIFADLYLDDYCVWLQRCASADVLKDLGSHVASIKIKKDDIDLPLKVLEEIGIEILEDEKLADEVRNVLVK